MAAQLPGLEQRRDLLFRAVVHDCQRALAPLGFRLMDRGTIQDLALVGFRHDAERAVPATQETVLVMGHDLARGRLQAEFYGPQVQPPRAWTGAYKSSTDVLECSREAVRTAVNWVAQLAHPHRPD
jgi:hypothetical protein